MRRRDFVKLAGGAAAWPLTAHGQQREPLRRMGVLMGTAESDDEGQSGLAAFREQLGKLGWTEGRNIEINGRWAVADIESMERFAKDALAAKVVTRTIPVVFYVGVDPVGLVASLNRPGGNLTGVSSLNAAGVVT